MYVTFYLSRHMMGEVGGGVIEIGRGGGKQSLEVHVTISSHTLVLHSLRFKKIIFWFMRSFCLLGCEFVEALSPYEACDINNQIAAGSLKLWYYILGEM